MNRKLFLLLLLFSTLVFAQQSVSNIREAMCDLVETSQTFLAMGIIIFILLAVPLIAAGIFLYIKKKEWKILGIILIIVGVAAPIMLAMFYLLMPYLISVLTGVEAETIMECS